MVDSLIVVAATANDHKLTEMNAVFGDAVVLLARPAEVPEIVEDAGTFLGNARLKAVAIADASGLEVDALGGAPGVESAYYGGGDHDDTANRKRLMADLAGTSDDKRAARFRTVMVLRWPDGAEIVAEGTCEGTIGLVERGDQGFGYDSLFIPAEGDGRTFGEHTAAEKNTISHRSRACAALLKAIKQ